eukprot:2805894-Amphidinium_carterae.1
MPLKVQCLTHHLKLLHAQRSLRGGWQCSDLSRFPFASGVCHLLTRKCLHRRVFTRRKSETVSLVTPPFPRAVLLASSIAFSCRPYKGLGSHSAPRMGKDLGATP